MNELPFCVVRNGEVVGYVVKSLDNIDKIEDKSLDNSVKSDKSLDNGQKNALNVPKSLDNIPKSGLDTKNGLDIKSKEKQVVNKSLDNKKCDVAMGGVLRGSSELRERLKLMRPNDICMGCRQLNVNCVCDV